MEQFEPRTTLSAMRRKASADYLYDMIGQMARLARQSGETYVAIHLEAIIAARRAISKDRP